VNYFGGIVRDLTDDYLVEIAFRDERKALVRTDGAM
jgi:hypothetical protein